MGGSGAALRRNVPYDSWGPMKNELIRDKEGTVIGSIEDNIVYLHEPEMLPITKKEILNDIDNWRNDDGTYGNEDTSINFAYKDGSFVSAESLNGKAYKKSGLVGASISTGDYESVWGGEMKNGSLRPWQTWSETGVDGRTNSYSGYKYAGAYKQRVKTIYVKKGDKYVTEREVTRKSTINYHE